MSGKKKIKNAIEINNPSMAVAKGHTLLYKSYTCPTSCCICRKLLAGKFYQGYHCSGCNKDMCRKCCGLQNCTMRLGTLNRAKMNSMSSIQEVQCERHLYYPKHICKVTVRRGDLVVSRQSINSMDTSRLSCNSGDLIEVLEVNLDGTILGRLSNLPGRTGLIPMDCVAKTSDTLRKCMSDRDSTKRRSSHSIPEHSADLNRPLSLVSMEIIKCNEDKNLEVSQQPWFFGELGREQANQMLESTDNGTFIVRHSTQQQQFVISLRYEGRGKHMKIEFCQDNQQYYLHDGRMFDSIIELINFYRANNLSEGFNNLDVTLKGTPLKGNIYRALHDYKGSTPFKYLSMVKGDLVTVIDTAGESNGWWKGRITGPSFERTGFFPLSFVERVVEMPEPNIAESYTFSPNGTRHPQHLLVTSPSREDNEATL